MSDFEKGGILNGKKVSYRDAGNGKYVTKTYADKHPKTIVRETKKSKLLT